MEKVCNQLTHQKSFTFEKVRQERLQKKVNGKVDGKLARSKQLYDTSDDMEEGTFPITMSKLFLYKQGTP